MKLIYNFERCRYEFICAKHERQVPRQAGFRFDWDVKVWHTTDARNAKRVAHYCDDQSVLDMVEKSLEASRPTLTFDPIECEFIWTSTPDERFTAKQADFVFDWDSKTWRTKDWECAVRIPEKYWNSLVRDEIENRRAMKKSSLAQSRAVSADVDLPVPDGLSYLPYQKAGIRYAVQRDGALIGDEMGLGKTIQGLGVMNWWLQEKDRLTTLIICPASLKSNWKREAEKWLIKDLNIVILEGKSAIPDMSEVDVVIINYDILKKWKGFLDSVEWDQLIVDESHYLKNDRSQRTRMVFGFYNYKLRKQVVDAIKAKHRVLLTGTPIPNRPVELFPLLNYLAPSIFPSFWNFANRYCDPVKDTYGWKFNGSANERELQDKMRTHVMVRRLKEEVLTELPPKIQQVITLPAKGVTTLLHKEISREEHFDSLIAEMKQNAQRAKLESKEAYQAAVRKLGEVRGIRMQEMSRLAQEVARKKAPHVIEYVKEILDNDPSHKIVLFGIHKDIVEMFLEAFAGRVVHITGDVPVKKRQGIVDQFQNDPSIQLFVGNIIAAGVGLTLTRSSHVVFAELDWTPGNMQQAEDRCHRFTQKFPVLVTKFVYEGSLDVRKIQALESKAKVQTAVLDAEYEPVAYDMVHPTEKELEAVWLDTELAGKRKEQEEASEKKRTVRRMTNEQKWDAKLAWYKNKHNDIDEILVNLDSGHIVSIHAGLGYLASVCDGAQALDGRGFNKPDSHLGKELASKFLLGPVEAALGFKLCRKYKKQLPTNVLKSLEMVPNF